MIPIETEGAESWFADLLRAGQSGTKSSKVTEDFLQSALTQGKRSQILPLEMVVVVVGARPNTHHMH